MIVYENEFSGTVVQLSVGDRLEWVPESHRDLLTKPVRKVFENPIEFARDLRNRALTPNMRKWFDRVVKKGEIRLCLEVANPPDMSRRAGFWMEEDSLDSAIIGLPLKFNRKLYPPKLRDFYSRLSCVDWMGVALAGKLDEPAGAGSAGLNLATFLYQGKVVDPDTTQVIGGSLCGDQMIATTDGRGGWWNHETNDVSLIGPVERLIDWVFGELLAKRSPECDAMPKKKSKR